MKLLKKEVFDINKVTVVGSPTITSDGVASGFSTANYILTNFIIGKNPFKIKGSFICSDNTKQSTLFSIAGGWKPIVFVNQGVLTSWADDEVGNSLGIVCGGISNDTLYNYEYTFTGEKYILSLLDAEGTLIKSVEKISSGFIKAIDTKSVVIGRLSDVAGSPFYGSIDLKQFSITVDGQLVFQPVKPTYLMEKRKEGFDLSKFTVVGSPTITEYGVLSNCSSNNIVQTSPINITNPNWEFNFVIDTNGMSGNVGVLGIPSIGFCYVTANVTTELCSIYLVQQWEGSGGVSIGSLPLNKKYQVVWGMNGTTHYSKIKEFGATEWLKEVTKTYETAKTTSSAISIGRDTANNLYLTNGSTDLSQFSITVDGKEVFTGAKEEYYMFK